MPKIRLAALALIAVTTFAGTPAVALNPQPLPPGARAIDTRINRDILRINVRGPRALPPNPCRMANRCR